MNRVAEWMERRDRILVMGILNVTPDSFFDGGRYRTASEAVDVALQMEADGADLIDVGGESSRPGAESISTEEELDRILEVLKGIRDRSDVAVSIDTTKADVAREAIAAGATLINDISALRADPEMAGVVSGTDCFVVLMHMKGTPRTMQENPMYDDVVGEIGAFLSERVAAATEAGISSKRIWIDPGIGFGKRMEHNLELLRHVDRLRQIGQPVLVGLSRKSFLGAILDLPVEERLEGTIAANAVAVARGADIVRVHDVKEGRRAVDVAFRLRKI